MQYKLITMKVGIREAKGAIFMECKVKYRILYRMPYPDNYLNTSKR